MNRNVFLIVFIILLTALYFVGLAFGSVTIPLKSLLGFEALSANQLMIIEKIRIPRNLTAILSGAGLALSGVLLQTLFRNPLAGPSILGITSGSSLGVAIAMLGGSGLGIAMNGSGIVIAAILGAMAVLLLISLISLKYEDVTLVLIAGLMLGFLSSSLVSIMAFFADAEKLKPFVHWGFGSFARFQPHQIVILFVSLLLAIMLTLFSYKALNAFLMGEDFARSLGVNIRGNRILIIVTTGILTGVITAYSGPVAFIGLAVPQMVKLIFKSNHHRFTIPASLLLGAVVALSCDIISRVPGSDTALPLNAITSLFGAPIVIWVLFRSKNVSKRIA